MSKKCESVVDPDESVELPAPLQARDVLDMTLRMGSWDVLSQSTMRRRHSMKIRFGRSVNSVVSTNNGILCRWDPDSR